MGIIDSSWRSRVAMNSGSDPLGEMLAAHERMLQARRIELQEAIEATESHRAPAWGYSSCSRAVPTAANDSTRSDYISVPEERLQESCNLMDENAARAPPNHDVRNCTAASKPLERTCDLTIVLTGDLLDELARGYSQEWFQESVRACARESRGDREQFVSRLHEIAFGVQRPILKNWGFDDDIQGVFDMTSIIREHTGGNGKEVPVWLQEKRDACLTLLYGGSGVKANGTPTIHRSPDEPRGDAFTDSGRAAALVSNQALLDFTIDEEEAGHIELLLWTDRSPSACKDFVAFCRNGCQIKAITTLSIDSGMPGFKKATFVLQTLGSEISLQIDAHGCLTLLTVLTNIKESLVPDGLPHKFGAVINGITALDRVISVGSETGHMKAKINIHMRGSK